MLKSANVYMKTLLPEEHQKAMGIVGFCWGGKQVMHACSHKELGYLAGVSVHGAWLGPEDAEKINVPVFFMPSGEDPSIEPLKVILDKRPFGDRCR